MDASTDKADSRQGRIDSLIEALLVAKSLHQAAQMAGVPYTTARNYWADPAFQAELSKARQEFFDSVIGRVRGMASKALDVLGRALDRGDQSAARYILDRALQLHNEDIEARLRKLEERVQ